MSPAFATTTAAATAVANFVSHGKKIVGVLRNYAAHAQELSNPLPTKLLFFLKPTTSYIQQSQQIVLPKGADVHHEVELGVVIGTGCKKVSESAALQHIGGFCLALDLTARNLQAEEKQAGLPWFRGKCYDTFCPVSPLIPRERLVDRLDALRLVCEVDGKVRQDASTRQMVFGIPALIAAASRIVTLEPGDLILTGTPEGVGPIRHGQTVHCAIMLADPSPASLGPAGTDKIICEMKFTAVDDVSDA